MKPLINKNGITIKQIKDLVKDLPETDYFGNDYEVWIVTENGLSSRVTEIMQLNQGDIIISNESTHS